jgi:creatinine amidohydrolase
MTEIRTETYCAVEPLLDPRAIALLPLGSTEPHGPHLPLDTDVCIAEARARRAGEIFAEAGVAAFVLPALPYGVTRLAQGFAGGVTLRPGSLWALIEDLALSLQQDGVRQLVLCNAHHEFEHTRVLANIASDYVERGPGRCQILYPDRVAPDEAPPFPREIDCHGGRGETSLMLAIAPQRVRSELLAKLVPVELELPAARVGVNRSLLELGARRAYCGTPAEASAAEGNELLDELAQRLVAACRRAWPDLFEPSQEQ